MGLSAALAPGLVAPDAAHAEHYSEAASIAVPRVNCTASQMHSARHEVCQGIGTCACMVMRAGIQRRNFPDRVIWSLSCKPVDWGARGVLGPGLLREEGLCWPCDRFSVVPVSPQRASAFTRRCLVTPGAMLSPFPCSTSPRRPAHHQEEVDLMFCSIRR